MDKIFKCGYSSYSYKKRDIIENNKYESLYYMNNKYDESLIKELSLKLLDTNEYGNVIRIKGYYKDNNKWYNINVTKDSLKMNNIPNGQDVIIVIGESLNKEKIDNLMERK